MREELMRASLQKLNKLKNPKPDFINKTKGVGSKLSKRNYQLVPSQAFLDPLSNPPTVSDPSYHVVVPEKLQIQRPIFYATAVSLINKDMQLNYDDQTDNQHLDYHQTRAKFDKAYSCGQNSTFKRVLRNPIVLEDYRPLLAPFVPEILVLLVNAVEDHCYLNSWSIIVEPFTDLHPKARKILIKLLKFWDNSQTLKRIIYNLSPPMQIVLIRLFLNELKVKPIYFSRPNLFEIAEAPLVNLFLHSNPNIRSILFHSCIANSCSQTDTAAFLMIHLLHVLEYSQNSTTMKTNIAQIYGPLLISFAVCPELRGLEPGEEKSPESALLESIMELCDTRFWNQLTMLKIRDAFDRQSAVEQYFVRQTSTSDIQSVKQFEKSASCYSDTDNSEETRRSTFEAKQSYMVEISYEEAKKLNLKKRPQSLSYISHGIPAISAATQPSLLGHEFRLTKQSIAPNKKKFGLRGTRSILKDLMKSRITIDEDPYYKEKCRYTKRRTTSLMKFSWKYQNET